MFLDKLGEKYQEKFWPRELTALKRIEHKNVVKVYHIIRGKLLDRPSLPEYLQRCLCFQPMENCSSSWSLPTVATLLDS